MGTLFDQRIRGDCKMNDKEITSFFSGINDLAVEHNLSADVIVKGLEVMVLDARNDLYRWNGDTWDEQIGGLGEIFTNLVNAVESLKDPLKLEK